MQKNSGIRLMGILNVTPDSFSDGGKFASVEAAVARAARMLEEGADIIDIGAESTRPQSAEISAEEELARLMEPLREIRKSFPKAKISVDTYKWEVAQKAVAAGADIINDVWGGMRGAFFGGGGFSTCDVASDAGCPIILMHNRPRSLPPMADLRSEIFADFERILENARACGVQYKNIILDGGFGFGKTPEQNMELLANYGALRRFGFPLLLGLSRKSTVRGIFGEARLEDATVALGFASAARGSSDILRVHDVARHRVFIGALSEVSARPSWR